MTNKEVDYPAERHIFEQELDDNRVTPIVVDNEKGRRRGSIPNDERECRFNGLR